jgi:signal transduction histidine kinase
MTFRGVADAPGMAPSASAPRILVVDDERRAVELLVRTLRSEGRIETAASAEEAWQRLEGERFDLVISDQRMPGMTGVELLGRLAERDDHVGRILLTGYSDLEATVEAINRGRVHAYLHKPCAPDDVKVVSRSVLERTRLARENEALARDLARKNDALEGALASLRDAQARVLHAERLAAIGRVIAMIVHDLRTPLSVILAAGAELQGAAELAPDDRRDLGRDVVAEAEHMRRLCSELLEVTQASEATRPRERAPLDDAVAAALASLAELTARAGVTLDLDLASDVALPLDTDGLQRALRNLVQNACDAMPEGGSVRVSTRREGGAAEIRVLDDGPGIPAEIAERLFEPFVTAGKARGTGLGLAVVRKIVDEHGGSVAAEKADGAGCAIRIRLPLGDAPA